MPRDGSSGVEATFQTSTRPCSSSNRQMSVNVPPESTPTRQRSIETILRPPGPWPRRHSVTRCAIEHADMRRSEEHTSELQSLMRSSYAVFCLKKQLGTILD